MRKIGPHSLSNHVARAWPLHLLLLVAGASLAACSPISASAVGDGSGGKTGLGGNAGQTNMGAGGIPAGGGAGGMTVVFTSPDASPDVPQSTCGNGVLDGTEQCDDGNTESGDGCSRICQIESNYDCPKAGQLCKNLAVCGNGVLTSDETCDDGNTKSGDGCSADCQGVESGWQCRVSGKPCMPRCGDSILSGSEACDDGNTKSGDGCSALCKVELGWKCDGGPSVCSKTTCGDSKKEGAEGCDDGNTMPFDGCSEDCQIEPDCSSGACISKCGDGIVLGEDCDDGNAAGGDGCSKDCKVEPGWTCKQPELGNKMLVPAIFRDFKMHNPSDFEPNDDVGCAGGKCVGMVKNDLDSEGKPAFTGVTDQGVDVGSADSFKQWYRSSASVNHANASKLALWKLSSGAYVNRYGANGEQWKTGVDGNPLFFPVDSDPFSSAELAAAQIPGFYDPSVPYDVDASGKQRLHNFSFTSEVRYWFMYDSTQSYQLDFLGDDDFWVFINRKLAVDLGGLHSATPGSVTLDAATAAKLGNMKSGNVYEVAVFHAERHTTASSFKLTLTGFNAAATTCTPTCGDGVAVADEECDNGKDNSDTAYGGCTTQCKWGPFCGDGVVNGPEECDSGKKNGMQYGEGGCTFGCKRAHFCGDGHVDTDRGEECDLGSKNGTTLDRNGALSTDPSALVYCTTVCKIPPGVVY
jgi:fibro-slime domain-containing protein